MIAEALSQEYNIKVLFFLFFEIMNSEKVRNKDWGELK